MKPAGKGLIMLALAWFFFSLISRGTLYFYINNRFAWLTFAAVLGFFAVSLGYLQTLRLRQADDDEEENTAAQPPHDHAHHDHNTPATRVAWFWVLLPVLLGLLVPARPLGAGAAGTREITVGSLNAAIAPGASTLVSPDSTRNLLDWLIAFDSQPDPAAFNNQPATLLGFVYRDSNFSGDRFMLSRFIVSCCVADATPIGVIVQWPAAADLPLDQWVEVSGAFQAGEFNGQAMPVLHATAITPTDVPRQPYLFP